jgi:hypothetical protein
MPPINTVVVPTESAVNESASLIARPQSGISDRNVGQVLPPTSMISVHPLMVGDVVERARKLNHGLKGAKPQGGCRPESGWNWLGAFSR